ncbi:peptidoglycan-associated lipoprotein Pal [Alphaproteobacteria bacterium KMM 3653]|uniref:Peptidoglycan-associated lipoprotein n=1 Tax=Harenicola maris TaxID=2841044 RepID=A0AAP2CP78_9RHOB|nr:peptidoglycan-associated lipoprotein Pal [Harenicola maris]
MTFPFVKPALIAALVLGLTACTDAGRFGKGGSGDDAAALNATGIDQNALDPANDPNSPAYFQQKVGDRVLFAVDQSSVSVDGRVTLDGQANWLTQNPSYSAIIEGHADEQGTREYNLALGARRANAVQEYLISRGVAGNRLRTVTYGKERPLEVCSEEACYAKNRRAVTVLSAGLGS